MIKQEFITKLEQALAQVPQNELERVLNFYNETIEDRMEDGMSEEEAITSLGSVEEIVKQTVVEKEEQEKRESVNNKKSYHTLRIVLLIITSSVWIPLLAVVFILYLALWMLLASIALILVCLLLFIALAILNMIRILQANVASGVVLIGTILCCIGIVPLLWIGLKKSAKWLFQQGKLGCQQILNIFVKVVA